MPVMRSYGASRLSQGWSCWLPGSEALGGDGRPRGDIRPGGASFTAPSGIIDGFCKVPASGQARASGYNTTASQQRVLCQHRVRAAMHGSVDSMKPGYRLMLRQGANRSGRWF